MGVKRLKIKEELHYRPGRTGHHCSGCDHFVSQFQTLKIGGDPKAVEPRCRIIGLEHGRTYRINPKYICDRYDNSKTLERLRGRLDGYLHEKT